MAGNFRCTNMHIEIISSSGTTFTIGVVDGFDIKLSFEGGLEPVYGSRTQVHSAGVKKATVTLSRWYFADQGKEDLLLNLFQSEAEFILKGSLQTNDGTPIVGTDVTISGVRLYSWRPKCGSANDIIGEEATGEGTGWTINVVKREAGNLPDYA